MIRVQWTMAALAALTAGAPAAAQSEPAKKTETVEVRKIVRVVDGKEVDGPETDLERLANSCSARKFETSAEIVQDGKKRLTKIRLCAKDGESDAQWVKTLKDALKRLDGMDEVSAESRTKIAADLRAEIDRLEKAN